MHKPVWSRKIGEYSTMAFGFTGGFDQKMSEPWVIMLPKTNLCMEFVQSNNAKAAYMEKKDPIPQDRVIHHLETAALHPQRRGEMIARALQQLLTTLPAIGTALVWPCQDRNVPWKVYYAG